MTAPLNGTSPQPAVFEFVNLSAHTYTFAWNATQTTSALPPAAVLELDEEPKEPCQFEGTTKNLTLMCVFTLIFCLSVIGNSVIIVIITQQRWMRTVTNVYLLNLAVADLLLSVLCMPPTLTGLVLKCFVFPTFVCPLLAYMQPVAVTASMYTLTVIAVERYYAICRPLRSLHWQTQAHAYRMISLVWLLSFALNLPSVFLLEATELGDGRWNCRPLLEGFLRYIQLANMIYMTFVLFIIPSIVMVLLYAIVIHTLRTGMNIEKEQLTGDNDDASGGDLSPSSPPPQHPLRSFMTRVSSTMRRKLSRQASSSKASNAGELSTPLHNSTTAYSVSTKGFNLRSTHTERSIAGKRRVIVMLVCVVIEFFICWTPLYTWLVIGGVRRVTNAYGNQTLSLNDPLAIHIRWTRAYHLDTAYLCLAYISSCCNPITYCFLNQKFRHAAMYLFGCGKFVHTEYMTRTAANNQPAALANLQRRASHLAQQQNGQPPHTMHTAPNGTASRNGQHLTAT